MPAPPLHVAVGVIANAAGEILISRRAERLHQGGLWEFPGGKLEPGEDIRTGLARELQEELGIRLDTSRAVPLKKVLHHYSDRTVLLDVWQVSAYQGEPRGLEGQAIRWSAVSALNEQEFPAADLDIIRMLQLPTQIAISGEIPDDRRLGLGIGRLAQGPAGLFQLRAPGLAPADLVSLGRRAVDLCQSHHLACQVNTTPELIEEIPGAGLHVSASVLRSLQQRPVAAARLFSASCHTLAELRQAERLGTDFVLLSPVNPTASHPGIPGLGWDEFLRLASQVHLPVYALGGLGPDDLASARNWGAQGIAGIRAYWHIQE